MFDKRIQRPSDREGRFFTLRGNIFFIYSFGMSFYRAPLNRRFRGAGAEGV